MAASDQSSDRKQDKALEDTFPASDAPANSGVTGAEAPNTPSQQQNVTAEPTGSPTSDRHATETAHQSEDQKHPD